MKCIYMWYFLFYYTVFLSNLSHQRTAPHRTVPHRTVPHRTAPYRTAPHRTAPKRYFAKMPLHLNVTFLTHRTMQRYIEKYAVTSIVTLNCNGKDHHYTNRYRYYRYRILKNKALQRPWQFIVTRDRDRCRIL